MSMRKRGEGGGGGGGGRRRDEGGGGRKWGGYVECKLTESVKTGNW